MCDTWVMAKPKEEKIILFGVIEHLALINSGVPASIYSVKIPPNTRDEKMLCHVHKEQ